MGEGIQTISRGTRNTLREAREKIATLRGGSRTRINVSRNDLQSLREQMEERRYPISRPEGSPKPTKVADLDSRSFKAAITRAHNYTDDNFHQVASATAARAFGYPDIEKGFRDIEEQHERIGSLNERLQRYRDLWTNELEKRIKRDYGQRGMDAWHRAKS